MVRIKMNNLWKAALTFAVFSVTFCQLSGDNQWCVSQGTTGKTTHVFRSESPRWNQLPLTILLWVPQSSAAKNIAKPEQVLTAKLCHLRRRAKNGEVRVLQIWDRFGLSLKNYEGRLFARQVVVSFKKFHPHVISWWSCTDRRTNITIRETTCARSSV